MMGGVVLVVGCRLSVVAHSRVEVDTFLSVRTYVRKYIMVRVRTVLDMPRHARSAR